VYSMFYVCTLAVLVAVAGSVLTIVDLFWRSADGVLPACIRILEVCWWFLRLMPMDYFVHVYFLCYMYV
jgi:hypothetical protein